MWRVAIYGGNLLLVCGGVLGMVMGASVGVRVRVCLVVVACLSLSSAPLAHRFVDSEQGMQCFCFLLPQLHVHVHVHVLHCLTSLDSTQLAELPW